LGGNKSIAVKFKKKRMQTDQKCKQALDLHTRTNANTTQNANRLLDLDCGSGRAPPLLKRVLLKKKPPREKQKKHKKQMRGSLGICFFFSFF
jgi:hypothetical protein